MVMATMNLKVENQNLSAENLQDIQWSEKSITLSEFVNTYPLPQIVQIEEGYHGGSDENSLSMGQVLKIHTLTTERKLLCYDRHEKAMTIPVHTQKISLKPSNYDTVYQRVFDLTHVKPLPNYVEVTRGYYNVDSNIDYELSVDPGETLEVIDINESSIFTKKTRSMTFRNSEGVMLKLPYDCVAGFKPLIDNTPHMLTDVIPSDANNYVFPFYFQFSDTKASKLGVIKVMSTYDDHLIIASCGQSRSQVVFMIPQNLNVKVKVAVGTLKDDPEYENIRRSYHNFKSLETDLKKSNSFRRRAHQSSGSEIFGIQIPTDHNGEVEDNAHPGWETFDNSEGNEENTEISTNGVATSCLLQITNGTSVQQETPHQISVTNDIVIDQPLINEIPVFEEEILEKKDPLEEIKQMSVEELAENLRNLNMNKHVEQFIDNQVDGSLFCELEEEELQDLGLNKFEIKKLFRFKNGWRPKLN